MLQKFYRFPSKLNINGGAIGGDEAFLGGLVISKYVLVRVARHDEA